MRLMLSMTVAEIAVHAVLDVRVLTRAVNGTRHVPQFVFDQTLEDFIFDGVQVRAVGGRQCDATLVAWDSRIFSRSLFKAILPQLDSSMRDTQGFSSTRVLKSANFRKPAPILLPVSPDAVGHAGHLSWHAVDMP